LDILIGILWFVCVSGVLYVLFMRVRSDYESGTSMLQDAHIDSSLGIPESPMLEQIGKLGVALMPQIQNWTDSNRFKSIVKQVDEVEPEIVMAGVRSKLSPAQFISGAVVTALIGGFVFTAAGVVLFGFPLLLGILFFPIGALVGFAVARYILKSYGKTRISLIEKRLPFAIEFMMLVMEANASFPIAMEVYRDQMRGDPIADELTVVLRDIESGVSTIDALNGMASRIDSQAVAGFVLAINTAISTGQPVKKALKVQADATRLRRYQNAEEIAKKASSNATFPLFLAFGGILLLLLGPLMYKMMKDFANF
jgi:pilus assembly protein TadC